MNALKPIVQAIFLAIFFFAPTSWAQQFDIGGEIGNPFRSYVSPSGTFGTLYPKTWNVLENHSAVSFIEATRNFPNAVGITMQIDASLSTPTGLAHKLIREYPNRNWRQIDVNGKTGFLAEESGRGTVYILSKPGAVVVTEFQTRSDAVSIEFVRKVIYSVKTP